MSRQALKLTIYFGERDRVGHQFLAERVIDIFEARGLAVSLLLRGVEGYGIKHHLRTDRLLTLSEDLPIVAVAVDEAKKIKSVIEEVQIQEFDGLITVERAQLQNGRDRPSLPSELGPEVKLTVYLGRGFRSGDQPAYERAVRVLHDHRVAGATVLIGVDGTFAGRRRRARFFSRNLDVPAMVISIGTRERINDALAELESLPGDLMLTLERVRSLKRDGRHLATLGPGPEADSDGRASWVKLMLYSGEQNQHNGHPAHMAAVRGLRAAGAPGATALRGVWGYHGDHEPHGDSFWAIRRRVPTVTVAVDRPARIQRWFAILDRVTPERGLITAEIVPAFQATAPDSRSGGLELAPWWRGGIGD